MALESVKACGRKRHSHINEMPLHPVKYVRKLVSSKYRRKKYVLWTLNTHIVELDLGNKVGPESIIIAVIASRQNGPQSSEADGPNENWRHDVTLLD